MLFVCGYCPFVYRSQINISFVATFCCPLLLCINLFLGYGLQTYRQGYSTLISNVLFLYHSCLVHPDIYSVLQRLSLITIGTAEGSATLVLYIYRQLYINFFHEVQHKAVRTLAILFICGTKVTVNQLRGQQIIYSQLHSITYRSIETMHYTVPQCICAGRNDYLYTDICSAHRNVQRIFVDRFALCIGDTIANPIIILAL